MSRNNSSSTSTTGGLMPLGDEPAEQSSTAGVFRLEAMAPGADGSAGAAGLAAPKKRKVSTQVVSSDSRSICCVEVGASSAATRGWRASGTSN